MKNTFLSLTVLLIQTVICSGQENKLISISTESNAIKSCRTQVENKEIGLSNITTDTLTFQQFRQCEKITIKSMLGEEVTSYKLSYLLPSGTDLVERTIMNDKLPEELIQSVIASGTKKLIFSEVIGTKGDKNILIGYRCFYLN